MPLLSKPLCAAVLVAAVFVPAVAFSEDNLKLAVGAPNNWDSGVSEIGQRAGIFTGGTGLISKFFIPTAAARRCRR